MRCETETGIVSMDGGKGSQETKFMAPQLGRKMFVLIGIRALGLLDACVWFLQGASDFQRNIRALSIIQDGGNWITIRRQFPASRAFPNHIMAEKCLIGVQFANFDS